ncbi:MAG: hypothetical protein HY673_13280 [Chloroflexi bacterium]|nr:hypothetical protein [Chloroflexota bacterium]
MKKAAKKKVDAVRKCLCPFCEEELMEDGSPFCMACKALMHYCSHCKIVIERSATVCPRCGGALS